MSIHANQPNPGQPRELNLQQTAEQFIGGLQRHFDMLAFNLASRECVTEAAYDRHARAPRAMPASQLHRNFEQTQAYARDLLVRQVVNDALNLAVAGMNNAHLFFALIKANAEHGAMSPEIQQQCQQAQQQFLQAPLDQKFDRLERDYGVMCELEDSLTSLGLAMQALMQQGGIVREPQVDSDKELKIELKTTRNGATAGDVWRSPEELEIVQKVVREGEPIEFSDTELQGILITVAVFAHQLFRAVSNYGRENRPGA